MERPARHATRQLDDDAPLVFAFLAKIDALEAPGVDDGRLLAEMLMAVNVSHSDIIDP